MNKKDFSNIQNELSTAGYLTEIRQVNKKRYNIIVNFEIIKTYKQRESCRKKIIKLHKKLKL